MCSLARVTLAGRGTRRIIVCVCASVSVAFGATACGDAATTRAAPSPTSSTAPSSTTTSTTLAPSSSLEPPRTTVAQDEQYFTEVAEADPALMTYEQHQGNVALRALLTDGSAFCALLQRGGGIDQALVSEAVGARSQEAQTHLPLSVTTYNTMESVALLTLCPSEQVLLPATDRNRIRSLGTSLAGRSG